MTTPPPFKSRISVVVYLFKTTVGDLISDESFFDELIEHIFINADGETTINDLLKDFFASKDKNGI